MAKKEDKAPANQAAPVAAAATAGSNKFAELAEQDAANAQTPQAVPRKRGMTTVGKIILFLGLPTIVGCIGLYTGYLASLNDPDRELKFDMDFALPFTLTLTMALVIGFQTKGFQKDKPDPLFQWPKVKKRRKIVHKHVVVGEDGEEKVIDEIPGEAGKSDKKND